MLDRVVSLYVLLSNWILLAIYTIAIRTIGIKNAEFLVIDRSSVRYNEALLVMTYD